MGGIKKRTTVEAVYCSARKTNGDPCRRRPINGGTVCPTHGGRAPQVRAAAQRRILAHADRAVAAVVAIMEDPATPSAVKLAAAKDLLDRNDLTGKTAVEITVKPWQELIDRIVVADAADARVPEPDPLVQAQILKWNAEATEPSAWDTSSIEPELLEAEVEAELVERRSPEPAPVESTKFNSKPPDHHDPDGLGREVPPRRRR